MTTLSIDKIFQIVSSQIRQIVNTLSLLIIRGRLTIDNRQVCAKLALLSANVPCYKLMTYFLFWVAYPYLNRFKKPRMCNVQLLITTCK